MSRSTNLVILSGHLGKGIDFRTTGRDKPVASFSLATDEGYRNRDTGEWINRAAWHRVVTYQPALVEMLRKHGTKGRFVEVVGKLRHRAYRRPGEDADRRVVEVLVEASGSIIFPVPERIPSEMEETLDTIQAEIDQARAGGRLGADENPGAGDGELPK